MRARYPDFEGHVERDGVQLGYEVFGSGDRTILLLPTWTIIHSRFWKMQVPYLSRHFRVITYDGPGNGRSDRVTDPERYTPAAYAEDAVAVLDECGADSAVVVGLSLGAAYGSMLASGFPDRVAALVMVGPSIPLTPPSPERSIIESNFMAPLSKEAKGWERYNIAYWHHDYRGFTEFFFSQCFNERHSTKAIEDSVGWADGADAEILEAEALAPSVSVDAWKRVLGDIQCPVLVIHGTEDRISPVGRGIAAARLTDGELVAMEGSGHIPNVRDPVRVNRILKDFIDRIADKESVAL